MSGDATGSDGVSDGTVVTLEGVVRKRRSLSRRLAFVDLETDQATSVPLVADGWSPEPSPRVCAAREGRLGDIRGARQTPRAHADGVIVLRDGRAENAWENASVRSGRARARDARRRRRHRRPGRRRDDVPVVGGPRRCSTPRRAPQRVERVETRRVARAEARRRGARDAACPGRRAGSEHRRERNLEPRVGRAKSRHNAVFAAWLVDTFGGVAGGEKDEKDEKDTNDKNDENASAHAIGPRPAGWWTSPACLLAFGLALEHGVPVTLVDPKPCV